MRGTQPARPIIVKAAIAAFLLDMILQFVDGYRYTYVFGPEEIGAFWLFGVPLFLIALAVSIFGLLKRKLMMTMPAPIALILLAYYSVYRIPVYYRPSGWPTPTPEWIHLGLIALVLILLTSPPSVEWYRTDSSNET